AAITLAIVATDGDSDTLTYSATGLPAGLSINTSTDRSTGTIGNQAADTSPYTVTVSASDSHNTGSTTFIWNVSDVTTPVLTSPGTQSHNEGAAINLAIVATDSDNDTLSYSATGLPAGLSIN